MSSSVTFLELKENIKDLLLYYNLSILYMTMCFKNVYMFVLKKAPIYNYLSIEVSRGNKQGSHALPTKRVTDKRP